MNANTTKTTTNTISANTITTTTTTTSAASVNNNKSGSALHGILARNPLLVNTIHIGCPILYRLSVVSRIQRVRRLQSCKIPSPKLHLVVRLKFKSIGECGVIASFSLLSRSSLILCHLWIRFICLRKLSVNLYEMFIRLKWSLNC